MTSSTSTSHFRSIELLDETYRPEKVFTEKEKKEIGNNHHCKPTRYFASPRI